MASDHYKQSQPSLINLSSFDIPTTEKKIIKTAVHMPN